MIKLTKLQIDTLALIRDGHVSQHNGGYGSWRIYGGNPSAVGRVVSMRLAVWGKPDGRDKHITLTDAGRAALSDVHAALKGGEA